MGMSINIFMYIFKQMRKFIWIWTYSNSCWWTWIWIWIYMYFIIINTWLLYHLIIILSSSYHHQQCAQQWLVVHLRVSKFAAKFNQGRCNNPFSTKKVLSTSTCTCFLETFYMFTQLQPLKRIRNIAAKFHWGQCNSNRNMLWFCLWCYTLMFICDYIYRHLTHDNLSWIVQCTIVTTVESEEKAEKMLPAKKHKSTKNSIWRGMAGDAEWPLQIIHLIALFNSFLAFLCFYWFSLYILYTFLSISP